MKFVTIPGTSWKLLEKMEYNFTLIKTPEKVKTPEKLQEKLRSVFFFCFSLKTSELPLGL